MRPAAPSLLALLLAALLPLAGCTPPVGATDLDVVSGFRVSPTFNAFTQPCEIRYTLDEPAYVQIRITRTEPDGSTALVRTITAEQRETAGPRTAAWRGVGPNGLFAPQGEYTVELYARLDGSDRTTTWTLTTIMYRA
ncbi:MAG: FlgD immunoglobulin-like domain containing protein [Rhodothermales bacterium]